MSSCSADICPECGGINGHHSGLCAIRRARSSNEEHVAGILRRLQEEHEVEKREKQEREAYLNRDDVSTERYTEENPKHIEAQKLGKTQYENIPWDIIRRVANAMSEGAGKYGRYNWRIDHIRATTYMGGIGRHLFGDGDKTKGWFNGEDIDPDSGENHLVKVIANCLLLLDATNQNTLIDDRLNAESKRA